MNYVVRITGPGVDHQVMVSSAEDFEALELIIAKMRRHFEAETPVDEQKPYWRLGRDTLGDGK